VFFVRCVVMVAEVLRNVDGDSNRKRFETFNYNT
jgi:hypothetical protein